MLYNIVLVSAAIVFLKTSLSNKHEALQFFGSSSLNQKIRDWIPHFISLHFTSSSVKLARIYSMYSLCPSFYSGFQVAKIKKALP